jgi:probable F420-dependent oxidoreductase
MMNGDRVNSLRSPSVAERASRAPSFALSVFPTDDTLDPGELAELAESHGYEALFFAEHTHIPSVPRPGRPDGSELPRPFKRTHDPFVAMTWAARSTTSLKVGTGICLVVERDPIITAKAVASLDHASDGRVLFGVGAGWLRSEMRNHGTDPRTRFDVMRERVEAMRVIWAEEEATYHGTHVSFEKIWCWPKPIQRPGPPVLVGGNGPTVLDRVLAFGDGWIPNRFGPQDDDDLLRRIVELQGRSGRSLSVTLNNAPTEPELLAPFVEAGVERFVWELEAEDRDGIERELEGFAAARDGIA